MKSKYLGFGLIVLAIISFLSSYADAGILLGLMGIAVFNEKEMDKYEC